MRADPELALAAAARETMRLADTVEVMLREEHRGLRRGGGRAPRRRGAGSTTTSTRR